MDRSVLDDASTFYVDSNFKHRVLGFFMEYNHQEALGCSVSLRAKHTGSWLAGRHERVSPLVGNVGFQALALWISRIGQFVQNVFKSIAFSTPEPTVSQVCAAVSGGGEMVTEEMALERCGRIVLKSGDRKHLEFQNWSFKSFLFRYRLRKHERLSGFSLEMQLFVAGEGGRIVEAFR